MKTPQVAIIGQPNVGKSTLFNALTKRSLSIVDQTAGTTRDRLSALINIHPTQNLRIELVDTGGIIEQDFDHKHTHRNVKNTILQSIQKQVELAIKEADVLIWVVDIRQGFNAVDQWIAQYLRPLNKPILLVANKADTPRHETAVSEFFKLGISEPIIISALQKRGLELLQTKLCGLLENSLNQPILSLEKESAAPVKIAIVGKRNVGKSTLVNQLAGDERVIVDEVPGTTRDAVDVRFSKDNKSFIAIDTAGLLHKTSITEPVDFYSQARTERAIKRADVVLFLIDARAKVSRVDKQIGSYLIEATKPCALVVNKWDLTQDNIQPSAYLKYLNSVLPGLSFAPITFISALTGFNIWETIALANELYQQSQQIVPTPVLNKLFKKLMFPQSKQGKEPKIYYGTQTDNRPPTLMLKINQRALFTNDVKRYLLNFLRKELPFKEIPIRLRFQDKGRPQRTQRR